MHGLLIIAAWRSLLYPADWQPGTAGADGRFLHDFSHAGYRASEAPIPDAVPGPVIDVTQPPYGADPTGSTDSTAAIQAALDAAGAAGGGTVFLPAGTYAVQPPAGKSYALAIDGSGVVLRGAGPTTRLLNTATDMRGRRILSVRPERDAHFSWYWDEIGPRALAADAAAGAMQVAVGDASGLAAGDWVILRADPTAAFIAEHGMTGTWTADVGGPIYYRRINSVSGPVVTLDAPLRTALKTRDAARLHRTRPHLHDVGIEDLAIGNVQNRTGGTGDDDHATPGTGAWQMHDSFAIYFTHVVDGWVRRVSTFRPAANDADVHILSNALRLDASRFITVGQCDLRKPQYRGEGGNGYLYVLSGSEALVVDSVGAGGRHNLSFSLMQSTGNVVLRTTIRDGRLPADFHMWLSAANLLDGVVVDRDHIEAAHRDCCGHGHATTQSVIWNPQGLAYRTDQFLQKFIVDSQQFGHGYVIGTRGAASAIRVRGGEGTEPLDWQEGIGQGAGLEPQSLFVDQLARRLGTHPQPGPDAGPGPDGDPDAGTGPGRDGGDADDAGATPPPASGCRTGSGDCTLGALILVTIAPWGRRTGRSGTRTRTCSARRPRR